MGSLLKLPKIPFSDTQFHANVILANGYYGSDLSCETRWDNKTMQDRKVWKKAQWGFQGYKFARQIFGYFKKEIRTCDYLKSISEDSFRHFINPLAINIFSKKSRIQSIKTNLIFFVRFTKDIEKH